jgi:hypothetical protein
MTGDRGLRLFKAAVDIARTHNLLRAWRCRARHGG